MKRISFSVPDGYLDEFYARYGAKYGSRRLLSDFLRCSIFSAVSSSQLFEDILMCHSVSSPYYNDFLEV